jgi:uncharacterized protein YjiS (DUF1127 family)
LISNFFFQISFNGVVAMSTTYGEVSSGQAAVSTPPITSFFKKCLSAYRERRQRRRLQASLCDLSDRELMDIGTTRGEIDYVASNRACDPRGAVDPR